MDTGAAITGLSLLPIDASLEYLCFWIGYKHASQFTAWQTCLIMLIISICLSFLESFSSLKVVFSFKRRLEFFIFSVFTPAVILVILSWCCFWISRQAVPARVSLGITTILTTILLSSSVNTDMPKVKVLFARLTGWLVGLFIYSFVCFFFNFWYVLNCKHK